MTSTAATESTPLIPSANNAGPISPKPHRTVTFSPHTTIGAIDGGREPLTGPSVPSQHGVSTQHAVPGQPVLSALNSKLRRRNSQSTPLPSPTHATAKIGPQRTTKTAQKLKLLPNPDPAEDGLDQESGRDVYAQFTRIKDPTARRDAARLGKADRVTLPRVTAYCTANAYRLNDLMKFLKGRGHSRGAAPKLFDECLYTPYKYPTGPDKARNLVLRSSDQPQVQDRRYSDSAIGVVDDNRDRRRRLIDGNVDDYSPLRNGHHSPSSGDNSEVQSTHSQSEENPNLDTEVHTPEVFLFEYGTVVIWGMSLPEEQRFLSEISKFEKEKLAVDDVQTENFNFYYTTEYQARIYNDFISLSDKKNYMIKLAISHALSQSVKVCASLRETMLANPLKVMNSPDITL